MNGRRAPDASELEFLLESISRSDDQAQVAELMAQLSGRLGAAAMHCRALADRAAVREEHHAVASGDSVRATQLAQRLDAARERLESC